MYVTNKKILIIIFFIALLYEIQILCCIIVTTFNVVFSDLVYFLFLDNDELCQTLNELFPFILSSRSLWFSGTFSVLN